MMTQKKRLIYFLLLFFAMAQAQQKKLTAIDVLNRASAQFKKVETISYDTNYILYEDFTSQNVVEKFSGIILKKNNVYYFKLKDTEFVTIGNVGLKINHKQKAIVIEESKNDIDSSPFDLEKFTKGFDSKLIESDSKVYICEFTPPKISQVMITKAIVHIDKSDFSIVKQIVYTANQSGFVEEKVKTKTKIPRLEITYTKRPIQAKDNELTLSENYFTVKKGEIILNPKWNSYTKFN